MRMNKSLLKAAEEYILDTIDYIQIAFYNRFENIREHLELSIEISKGSKYPWDIYVALGVDLENDEIKEEGKRLGIEFMYTQMEKLEDIIIPLEDCNFFMDDIEEELYRNETFKNNLLLCEFFNNFEENIKILNKGLTTPFLKLNKETGDWYFGEKNVGKIPLLIWLQLTNSHRNVIIQFTKTKNILENISKNKEIEG